MLNDSPQVVAIRARYKASFKEKKQLIDDFIDQMNCEPVNDDVLPLLNAELHKLAGSSGMYGYNDISLLCRSIMQEISNDCFHQVLSDTVKLSELFCVYLNKKV